MDQERVPFDYSPDAAPGGNPGGPLPIDPEDPLAPYHQAVLDKYDQIQKATQARIQALHQMVSIQAPEAKQLQISPIQALLATIGAGIAGSSDRMNGGQVAQQALAGFMSNASHRNDVENQNAQTGYQNKLRAANVDSEIAGEGVNSAQTGLQRAQTEEYRQSQLSEKHTNGILQMIDRMVSPTQMAKLKPADADGYYNRLNKLYKSAGMGYMMMTPTEISAAVEGLKAREKAAGDEKEEQKNAEIGQRIYNAAMANPSSPRSRQMLAVAKTFFPANSAAQQQIDSQISNIGQSMGETKNLTDSQRAAVREQIKGLDKQLDVIEKNLRGSKVPSQEQADRYVKLAQQRQDLANQLIPPAPPQNPADGSAQVQGGGFNITLPPGAAAPGAGAPMVGAFGIPQASDKVKAGPKPRAGAGGPEGRDTLNDFDRKQWDNAHAKIVSIKTNEIPALEEQIKAAQPSAIAEDIASVLPSSGAKGPVKTPNKVKLAQLQTKLQTAREQLQRWVQRAEAILPGSIVPKSGGGATAEAPAAGGARTTKSGNTWIPG